MTNLEVITTALRLLGVIDAHQTATAEDAALGLSELNDLMTDLEADGIRLGYPKQNDTGDDWPLDDSEAAHIKPLLAIRLFDFFPSQKIPDSLPGRASAAMSRLMRNAALDNAEQACLSNLPPGSAPRHSSDIINDN